jgi:hypothetical protein
MILVITCIPILAFGKFENEFLRLNIILASVIFTYFANEHYVIRLVVSHYSLDLVKGLLLHIVVILGLDYLYMREYLMQLGCYTIGMCKGGSTFKQLSFLKSLKINNGLVLVNGHISFEWLNVQFWRTFLAMILHFASLLVI